MKVLLDYQVTNHNDKTIWSSQGYTISILFVALSEIFQTKKKNKMQA